MSADWNGAICRLYSNDLLFTVESKADYFQETSPVKTSDEFDKFHYDMTRFSFNAPDFLSKLHNEYVSAYKVIIELH